MDIIDTMNRLKTVAEKYIRNLHEVEAYTNAWYLPGYSVYVLDISIDKFIDKDKAKELVDELTHKCFPDMEIEEVDIFCKIVITYKRKGGGLDGSK
ncbi:MAG TPA: hypothetical protein ENF41_03385 [Candidatus Bathyarchaeota archaeon]|nr:hypothetical protein [Candidatus Bathyarchaeota archaeon]